MTPFRILLLLLVCASALVVGCKDDSYSREIARHVGKIEEGVKDAISEPQQSLDLSVAELKKLQQFEYKVVSMPTETPEDRIEATLNQLGQERWDCSFAGAKLVERETRTTFFCKRRPATPLRYVPRGLLGSQ